MENDALDLGTHFWLHFDALADNQESYTVPQLVTALETTTTLRTLAVSSYSSVTVNVNSPRIVEPLCRCLADLRLQNEQHPLKAIHFHYLDSDIVRQFFVALKQCGIPRVLLRSRTFPIRFLIDFCRDNSNLKVLNLKNITFADEDAADRIGYSAAITLNLDKLMLDHVRFKTLTAATNFAQFLVHLSVSDLELGTLQEEYCEIKIPSVEQLTLYYGSEIKHFKAALDAGMLTVKRLNVQLDFHYENETTKKLKSLTRMIRGGVKLNSLTIHSHGYNQLSPPRQLFQALAACASVTGIHVNGSDSNRHDFTELEVQQLRRITVRNSELGQFMANTSSFSRDKLLTLMIQLSDCPSGLYMLTRRLPETFSFQKGNSLFPLMVDPNPTRMLRKRRKISYKE